MTAKARRAGACCICCRLRGQRTLSWWCPAGVPPALQYTRLTLILKQAYEMLLACCAAAIALPYHVLSQQLSHLTKGMHGAEVMLHPMLHVHGRTTCTAAAQMARRPTQGILFMAMPWDSYFLISAWLDPLGRFGGVLLGPARFTHINNAARQLLEAQGFIQRGSKAPSARRKAGR